MTTIVFISYACLRRMNVSLMVFGSRIESSDRCICSPARSKRATQQRYTISLRLALQEHTAGAFFIRVVTKIVQQNSRQFRPFTPEVVQI